MCEICYRSPCHPSCPNYEPEICTYCEICESPIYEGDKFYEEINGCIMCVDCLMDYISEHEKTAEK